MEKSFGEILKNLRRAKEVSQRALAEKVGVDFTYISKIENDRLPPPSADTIVKICKALDIPNEILLAHSGKVSSELQQLIGSNPEAIRFLNEVKEMNLTDTEWKVLTDNLKKLR